MKAIIESLEEFLSTRNEIYKDYIGQYCIIRSRDQGVMAGEIESVSNRTVKLKKARQLYAWSSEFVLVELGNKGPRRDSEQRYSAPSELPVLMTEVCGIIPCTEEAKEKIVAIKNETHD